MTGETCKQTDSERTKVVNNRIANGQKFKQTDSETDIHFVHSDRKIKITKLGKQINSDNRYNNPIANGRK